MDWYGTSLCSVVGNSCKIVHSLGELSGSGLDGGNDLVLLVLWESLEGLFESLGITLTDSLLKSINIILVKTSFFGGLLDSLLELPLGIFIETLDLVSSSLSSLSQHLLSWGLSKGGCGFSLWLGGISLALTSSGIISALGSWAISALLLSLLVSSLLLLEALNGVLCDSLEAFLDVIGVASHGSSNLIEGFSEIGKIVLGLAFGISLEGSSSKSFVDGINIIR